MLVEAKGFEVAFIVSLLRIVLIGLRPDIALVILIELGLVVS